MKQISLIILVAVLTACASDYMLLQTDNTVSRSLDTNYYAFDHVFTDKAEAAVRVKAEELCRERGLVAVRTTRACTLNRCKTNYQCMEAGAAKNYVQ